jgi:hypothetical protein
MLDRALVWQRLAREFALGVLGCKPLDPLFIDAFALPPEQGCRILL